MASTTRYRRGKTAKMPTLRDLAQWQVVLTPGAREILPDDASVLTALREALPDKDGPLPEEVTLWAGAGNERVVAFINRYVQRVFVERIGLPGSDPRKDFAIRVVSLGIGSRPDLPSGVEYVRRVRGVWRGLLPRERP